MHILGCTYFIISLSRVKTQNYFSSPVLSRCEDISVLPSCVLFLRIILHELYPFLHIKENGNNDNAKFLTGFNSQVPAVESILKYEAEKCLWCKVERSLKQPSGCSMRDYSLREPLKYKIMSLEYF